MVAAELIPYLRSLQKLEESGNGKRNGGDQQRSVLQKLRPPAGQSKAPDTVGRLPQVLPAIQTVDQ